MVGQGGAPAAPALPRIKKKEFMTREEWLVHVNEEHGGLQRFRNTLFSVLQLKPYKVTGQEWRASVANFSECFARSTLDWEKFTPEMQAQAASEEGLPPESRCLV